MRIVRTGNLKEKLEPALQIALSDSGVEDVEKTTARVMDAVFTTLFNWIEENTREDGEAN